MHELGITQAIIDQAREAAQANGAVRVTELFLTLTPVADFSQESIEMYFEMLAGDDGFFAGATLQFDNRPVQATCMACGGEFTVHARHEGCPSCSSLTLVFDPEAAMVELTNVSIDDGSDDEGSGGA